MPDPKKDERFSALRTGGLLLAIPALLIVSPLVGFFAGSAVDRWLRSTPWFTLIGLVLGFVAGARETYLIYRRYQAEADKESTRRRP
jgi:ATP synthase protein I